MPAFVHYITLSRDQAPCNPERVPELLPRRASLCLPRDPRVKFATRVPLIAPTRSLRPSAFHYRETLGEFSADYRNTLSSTSARIDNYFRELYRDACEILADYFTNFASCLVSHVSKAILWGYCVYCESELILLPSLRREIYFYICNLEILFLFPSL